MIFKQPHPLKVPSYYVCLSFSPPNLNSSKLRSIALKHQNYLSRVYSWHYNSENQNSVALYLKPPLLTILVFSLSHSSYQKNERAQSGNLLTKSCSCSLPTIKCLYFLPLSFSHHLSSSKCCVGSQVPVCCCMLLMQPSLLKLTKIKHLCCKGHQITFPY
jgi:hypothetical protein